ncbi:MAG: hypothetical protein AB8B64_22460 [Granulosicoccus sp.]
MSAVSIHRAVYRNQALAQRRSLYELLSIIGYLVAVALCLFSVLSWVDHSRFVYACTAIWAVFSLGVVLRLWWTNPANKTGRVLEFPDTWEESADMASTDSATVSTLAIARAQAASDPSPAVATWRSKAEPAPVSSFEKIKARAAQLQQYRHARLLRYKQKRSTTRLANSNLSAYLQKL